MRYLEADVGIALRHRFVPNLTTPVQINLLRSFPSEIRLPEVFAKIKNYPASSSPKFSHYSFSIHLLELLLEVSLVSSKFLRVRDIIPVPKDDAIEALRSRRQSEIEEKLDLTKNQAPSQAEAISWDDNEPKNSETQEVAQDMRPKRRTAMRV